MTHIKKFSILTVDIQKLAVHCNISDKISELKLHVPYSTETVLYNSKLQYKLSPVKHARVEKPQYYKLTTLIIFPFSLQLFRLGITRDTDYKTPNSEYMSAQTRQAWFADRAGVALYIAAHRGHQKLCDKLIQAG